VASGDILFSRVTETNNYPRRGTHRRKSKAF